MAEEGSRACHLGWVVAFEFRTVVSSTPPTLDDVTVRTSAVAAPGITCYPSRLLLLFNRLDTILPIVAEIHILVAECLIVEHHSSWAAYGIRIHGLAIADGQVQVVVRAIPATEILLELP